MELRPGTLSRHARREDSMSSGEHQIPSPPKEAQAPRGVNHLVLNVTNMEASHRFWTEIMGFRQLAELRPKPGRPPMKMRFYSGVDEKGAVNHHDIALAEIHAPAAAEKDGTWSLAPRQIG